MKPVYAHRWDVCIKEAMRLQEELAHRVTEVDQFDVIKLVAGVDVAYEKNTNRIIAAVIVLDANSGKLLETQFAEGEANFAYQPGLFAFRELPILIQAIAKLSAKPDLFICDGQGIAHPRKFGLACHLGTLYETPTIGCAKNSFFGNYLSPNWSRGSASDIVIDSKVVGAVLRTQDNIKPVFVSVGHRIALKTAQYWILRLAQKYRLPETTRQADQAVKQAMRSKIGREPR
jgi:deoxyribonuclease V